MYLSSMKWTVQSESGLKLEMETGVTITLVIAGEEYEVSITKK